MKLYAYKYDDGTIQQAEAEAVEKVILVPEKNIDFPFIYRKRIDKEDIGELIGGFPTVFLKHPGLEYAREKFLENARERLEERKNILEYAKKEIKEIEEEIRDLELIEAEEVESV